VGFFHADTRRLAAEAAADHLLIAACPCVGPVNTGMAIFEAARVKRSAAIARNAATYVGLSRLHRRG
jgi:hypothetical protein